MVIKVLPNVRFKLIPAEMLTMFSALYKAGADQGIDPVITGASDEHYPAGKSHDQGYALDVRVSGVPYPMAFANNILVTLRAVSPHYKVLFGDPGHLDHIHIGFAPWYSADRRTERERAGKR